MNSVPDRHRAWRTATVLVLALFAAGCREQPPLAIAPHVDLDRFMGDWHVIACIPTFIERNAFAAVESYRRAPDGRVLTTFTFRAGGFDGPVKTYRPVGFVDEASHGAVWGMRFLWPVRADYRVMYVDPEYRVTVIGRTKRDYAWIMARAPVLDDATYASLVSLLHEAGYDVSALRLVPQPASP